MKTLAAIRCSGLALIGAVTLAAEQASDPRPSGFADNSPWFRGPEGSGRFTAAQLPSAWNEKEKTGILWKTKIPMAGLGSPVVWQDKVFLSGATRENRALYCFSTADGALLWTGTYKSSSEASTEYPVYDSLDRLMHAAPTPATDGKRVYAMFGNGELAAFDIATGKALWSKVVGMTDDNPYGLSSSLLALADSVIVMFDGDSSIIARYDGSTGSERWKTDRGDDSWASPVLAKTASGKIIILTCGSPEVAAWDTADGKQLWSAKLLSGDVAPSPIAAGGIGFVAFADCGIFAVNLDTGKEVWSVEELEEASLPDTSSMTTDGKMLYLHSGDYIAAVNAETGKVAYEKALDYRSSYASPMVVNDRLYLFCGPNTVVLKTGPKFEQTGICSLDDTIDCSPALAGGRLFIRTGESLYCIGSAPAAAPASKPAAR